MRKIITTLLLIYLLIAPSVSAQTPIPTLPVGSNTFLETWNGSPKNPDGTYAPDAPKLFSSPTWDIMAHRRDNKMAMGPFGDVNAHHGTDCGPYPATHYINNFADSVYLCRDHIMTAIRGDDYGAVVLTPNQMVDFTNGEAVIRFDISTLRVSDRDWWDIFITPFDEVVPMPIVDEWLPDGYARPANSVLVQLGGGQSLSTLIMRNNNEEDHRGTWWVGTEGKLVQSATRRDTVEIRIRRDHIKVGMPGYNLWWTDEAITPLSWTKGVVQLGHHSYTPFKDGNGGPNIWHWDNLYISHAVPFTMIQTDESPSRIIDTPTDVVRLLQSAPANTKLVFHMRGTKADVSFDGGNTWLAPTQRRTDRMDNHMKPLGINVPVGATEFRVRGVPLSFENNWWARNFQVWSTTAGPTIPTNTPVPTTTNPTPTSGSRRPGDCDRDGDVDIFDYNILVGAFGLTTDLRGDFNNNNNIDIFDYNTLVGNFGQ